MDTISSVIGFCLTIYPVFICTIFSNENFSYPFLLTLALLMSSGGHFCFASCFVTAFLKHGFVFHSEFWFQVPENLIRKYSILGKFCLVCFYVILDQVGPIQIDPMPFKLLTYGSDLHR